MKRTLASCGALLSLLAATPVLAEPPGNLDRPIVIAINDWTGQHLSARVLGSVLKEMGYKVEYVTAGAIPQIEGLGSGSLSVQPEIWNNGIGAVFDKAVQEGRIEVLGDLGLNARDGWAYTAAVKEICPGLPDWKALMEPACAEGLASPETYPDGRLLDYPADWGTAGAAIIRNFDMPLVSVPGGSEGAMVAELQAAGATNAPLLMRFWSPHWILSQVPLEWVDMPPCEFTGEEAALNCILPPPVVKISWSGMGAEWPAAHSLVKLFTMTAEEQAAMIYRVDQEGADIDAVVGDWMAANAAKRSTWIAEATR